ncbi:putative D-lactate dehydrogenase [Glarea lozoyensis 74030]|uniref:D-lactate dehydrogenase (cytochrome) n=1 Tax=Glarea lozoyensis (strain ATCC 74030 / MF5533) TaxID=1104152 RepID=H0EF69_GLAL7|nr:putative D-lactate dehydrogenase [Glarea lozoyensis 74030]
MSLSSRTLRNLPSIPRRLHPSTPRRRHNSTFESKPYRPYEPPSPKPAPSQWTPKAALALGCALSFAFTAGKAYQKMQQLNVDYDRDDKFRAPRYASVKEMEKAISEIETVLGRDAIIPMTAYSGGSSLEGNFSAPYSGISIDFREMSKILAFHEEDMDVVVQPAVNWVSLNTTISSSGLFFPVDPSPSAQIGGMVGTNCSGTNAVRYGTMKDWVVNLTVVLADGTIIKTRGRPRKSAAGYNLNGLFVGSEGTLGLVTEVTLRLAAVPRECGVASCVFTSVRDAASTASSIMRAGVQVAAVEYLDATQMKVLNDGAYTAPKFWKEAPTLFFKFSGSKASIAADIKEVKSIVAAHKGSDFEFARSKEEGDVIWSGRKQALWSLLAARPEGTELWTTDVAVPVSRLADMIEESQKGIKDLGLFSSIVGHVGDGNFHEAIMYHRNDPAETAAVTEHVKKMTLKALEMEGTSSRRVEFGNGSRNKRWI